MNINELYDQLPKLDALINIEIENNFIDEFLTEYEHCSEYCLCFYGVSKIALDEYLVEAEKMSSEYICKINECISVGTLWDLCCKPILLFENKETAIVFMDFANSLSREKFVLFVDGVASDYYKPWMHVQMVYQSKIYDIIEFYERKFSND